MTSRFGVSNWIIIFFFLSKHCCNKYVEALVVGMITEGAYRTVDDNEFCTTSTSWVSFGLLGDNEHGGDDMDWIISSTNDDGKAFIFGA